MSRTASLVQRRGGGPTGSLILDCAAVLAAQQCMSADGVVSWQSFWLSIACRQISGFSMVSGQSLRFSIACRLLSCVCVVGLVALPTMGLGNKNKSWGGGAHVLEQHNVRINICVVFFFARNSPKDQGCPGLVSANQFEQCEPAELWVREV